MLNMTELQARTEGYRKAALKGQWNNYEGPSVAQMDESFDGWLDEIRAEAVESFKASLPSGNGRHTA